MNLYCYHTRSYEDILSQFFLPSLQDDYEIVLRKGSFEGDIVNYHQDNWSDITRDKVGFIIEAIEQNWMKRFVFSDPDIQFFSRTEDLLVQLSNRHDMVLQRADPWGGACTGYFVCLGNQKTLKLWQDAYDLIDDSTDDQDAVNQLLRPTSRLSRMAERLPRVGGRVSRLASQHGSNAYNVTWKYLPLDEFFLPGAVSGEIWNPDMSIDIPRNIRMHHASWVVGEENKVAQLRHVRDVVSTRTSG